MHQVETLVDVFERQDVGNHRVDLDLAIHVPVDDLRHVGAAPGAAKRRATPGAPGDELERPGRNLLPRAGNADDDRFAPALVGAFERCAHHLHIADALEGIIGATAGQFDEVVHQIVLADILRIDEVGHAELATPLLLGRVHVDANHHVGAHQRRTLDDVEPDAAETEHDDVGAGFHLGRVDDGTDAGRHPAADVTDLVERCFRVHLGKRDFRQHGVIGEGRAAHVVEDFLALVGKPRCAVRHQPLSLG